MISVRNIHTQTAKALVLEGDSKKAVEVLDRMQEVMIPSQFPLNASLLASLNEFAVMESIELYLRAGEKEKALDLGNRFIDETLKSIDMFAMPYRGMYLSKSDIESNLSYLFYVADIYKSLGLNEEGDALDKKVEELINSL